MDFGQGPVRPRCLLNHSLGLLWVIQCVSNISVFTSVSSWRSRKFLCLSLSFFAQQVPRLVHMARSLTTAITTRVAVGMVSVEKSAATALTITSAVRTNAVTHRMAIAILALYSAPQPL